MPVAAHGKRRSPDRAAEIEGKDLRVAIAAELERHKREQHGLACAGWTGNEGMADIANMEREAERGRSFCPSKEERRRPKMLIPFRASPDRRKRHHVREIQCRERRLADICVGMAGQ